MPNRKVLFLSLFIVIILFIGFFGLFYKNNLKEVKADALDNVSGFAWSSDIGWISFNNSSGGGGKNYGVNIDDNGATGLFKDYAWSSNVGWIGFNPLDWVGVCPASLAPCSQATVDKKTGEVSGVAQFLRTGDWVRLRGNGCNVSIDKGTGDFSGYGWGGETAGWMNFNGVSYKVHTSFDMNIRPTVSGMAVVPGDMCAIPPSYNFFWVFNDEDAGDTQDKYQIQIAKQANNWAGWVAGPGEFDSGIVTSGTQNKTVNLVKNPLVSGSRDYNNTYKWRVKVWDNQGRPSSESNWFDGSAVFSTPIHVSPTPNFDWKPKPIIKDQQIQFCSAIQGPSCLWLALGSDCYDNFNNKYSCLDTVSLGYTPTFAWIATNALITGGASANPIIKFSASGNQSVTLRISDNIGNNCFLITPSIKVTLPLPKYKEILPQ